MNGLWPRPRKTALARLRLRRRHEMAACCRQQQILFEFPTVCLPLECPLIKSKPELEPLGEASSNPHEIRMECLSMNCQSASQPTSSQLQKNTIDTALLLSVLQAG